MSLRHKLLHISSRDRDLAGSSSTSDFIINANNTGIHNAQSVVVKQISFPNVFYNITSKNNTFTYNIASSPTSVTIVEGQYNITTFITALQTAATAVGLALTQNATTLKLEATTTTAIEWLDITSNAMAEVLGIEYGAGSGADVSSYNATGLPDLNGESVVFIESDMLGQSNLLRATISRNNMLAVVPLTVSYGLMENYISNHSEIDDVDVNTRHGKNIQKIDIRLLDHDGNVLDLNGHHCSIILKVYY